MKQKELEKISSLVATQSMMSAALDDSLHRKKTLFGEDLVYQYGLYMRCKIHKGILYTAFYLAEHMRSGGSKPAYELFITRKKKQFITYDRLHDKWMTAKLDRIYWPAYVVKAEQKWIDPSDYDAIKKYLGGTYGGYEGLLQYQQHIREEELKQRHKKETDPWDVDLKQIPKLPKDWNHWVDKVGIPENYIFYQYCRKGALTGYCTYCGKNVPIHQPHYNEKGRCPSCLQEVTYKSVGKAGTVNTNTATMYLIQRCKDGFVIRNFTGYRKYPKGNYMAYECSYTEIRRAIYDRSAQALRAYYWGDYKKSEIRWIPTGLCTSYWFGNTAGRVYGKTLPNLSKEELSRTGLVEALTDIDALDPEKYLAVLKEVPQLEKLAKAHLSALVQECVDRHSNFCEKVLYANAGSLTKMLGIHSQELKRLRQNQGGVRFLDWLKYEKATDKMIPDNIIAWFCTEKITVEDLRFILNRMSVLQIYNYIQRQMSAGEMTSREVLDTWTDYLLMAKRLKMDTNDAIIFRANKLRQRHDELVERCQEKSLTIKAGEILEKYPHVDDICQSLKEKYEYATADYTILAPSCIEDVMMEGRNLHHCVSDSERYWERIERKETYILFLRRTSETEKSYYTLEVEPNGTVRQKRTMYDRQEPDIEDASKFLLEWQKVISRRLTEEDRKLSEESRNLRCVQYEQLRKDQVIIHTGELAGQLLVNVLLADLMENRELQESELS